MHFRAIGEEPPSTAEEKEEARATRLAGREAAAALPKTAAPAVLPTSVLPAEAAVAPAGLPAKAKPANAKAPPRCASNGEAKAQPPVMVHRGGVPFHFLFIPGVYACLG